MTISTLSPFTGCSGHRRIHAYVVPPSARADASVARGRALWRLNGGAGGPAGLAGLRPEGGAPALVQGSPGGHTPAPPRRAPPTPPRQPGAGETPPRPPP